MENFRPEDILEQGEKLIARLDLRLQRFRHAEIFVFLLFALFISYQFYRLLGACCNREPKRRANSNPMQRSLKDVDQIKAAAKTRLHANHQGFTTLPEKGLSAEEVKGILAFVRESEKRTTREGRFAATQFSKESDDKQIVMREAISKLALSHRIRGLL